MTRYYASYFYGSLWFNSWYYGGGATPPPPESAINKLTSQTGSGGGYFVPEEFLKQRDTRRQWDTDDELFIIMGGPLL